MLKKLNKIKKRCVVTPSSCVQYELELPEFSELTDCVTIEETTEELYKFVGEIKNLLDFTDLEGCEGLALPTTKTALNLFQYLIDRDCAQKELIATMQSTIETMQEQITNLQNSNCP